MRRGDVLYGKCKRVIDGDTFVLQTQTLKWDIRIYGIDAPEKGQAFYRESRRFLKSLIHEQRVECLIVNKDRYSRLVAQVRLMDETDVSYVMLEAGMAWYFSPRAAEVDYYTIACVARANRIGIFSRPYVIHPHLYRESKRFRSSRSR